MPDSRTVQDEILNPIQRVGIGSGGEDGARIDATVHALKVIDTFHQEIHAAEAFIISKLAAGVADDANIDFFIAVGAKELHMNFGAAGGGDAYLYFYEGSTHSSGGVAVTPYNMRRNSSEVSTAVFTQGGVNVTGANSILEVLLPGGTAGRAIGAQAAEREEIILKCNTNYLARLTNKAGLAKDFSIKLSWYEEDP